MSRDFISQRAKAIKPWPIPTGTVSQEGKKGCIQRKLFEIRLGCLVIVLNWRKEGYSGLYNDKASS